MTLKQSGYDFWTKSLNSAKHIVAPMVDQSELAWRLLSRRHGAQLCYTPMLNAKIMLTHPGALKKEFQTCEEDHPLIAQFCGNDPDMVLGAARMVESQVEGVDLNLGCPQNIARKGHYGAYLQDEWKLVGSIVRKLDENLSVPVSAKIRIFNDAEHTLKYARMIQDAGAQILTVHGRRREQRGELTGMADWSQIALIKKELDIPVFANGNILSLKDIQRCMEETRVDGVMTAEGNLYNPCIFEESLQPSWSLAQEYLDLCREHPAALSAVRGHMFKLFRPCLAHFPKVRLLLGEARTFDSIVEVVGELSKELQEMASKDGQMRHVFPNSSEGLADLPMWVARAHVRTVPNPSAQSTTLALPQSAITASAPARKKIKV